MIAKRKRKRLREKESRKERKGHTKKKNETNWERDSERLAKKGKGDSKKEKKQTEN